MSDQFLVGNGHTVNLWYMFLGYDQDVGRSLRINVVKGNGEVVFMDGPGGNLFRDDSAENAVPVVHGCPSGPEKLLKKQVRDPVWHAGPV